jgi:hypothetical protein
LKEIISSSNEIIKINSDQKDEAQSKVYFMAYELIDEEKERQYNIYQNEKFWKYRPLVTFEKMHVELENNEGYQFKILRKFCKDVKLV